MNPSTEIVSKFYTKKFTAFNLEKYLTTKIIPGINVKYSYPTFPRKKMIISTKDHIENVASKV